MFTFKQFAIKQDKCAMKVGTDGVLLGAWVDIKPNDRHILDIGAGTGLISLMMAQRCKGANIDGVEIDNDSALQAKENIEASIWSQRVNIHNVDINQFSKEFKYDLIVSNPPFFNDSLKSPNQERTNARHTTTLSFSALIDSVNRLLSNEGRFALILPTDEFEKFDIEAKGKLFASRICKVYSRVDGDYKRVMCEYIKSNTTSKSVESVAIREAKTNDYTSEYRQLTSDFYLKF